MPGMTTKKKIILGICLVVAVPVLWYGFWGIRLAIAAQKEGYFDKTVKREYKGDSTANLKAIRTALLLYQDSEGAMPMAESWMDAAWKRLQTADMEDDEAKKKLKRDPDSAEFGYAFNEAVGGKHTLDVPKTTILVFESTESEWNAHGKPENPGAKAITVDGKIINLK